MADDLLDDWHLHAARARARIRDTRGETGIAAVDAHASGISTELLQGRASLEGERVAILAAPSARFVAALIGIWKAGGTAVVLLPEHPDDEHAHALADSGATTLLVSSEHAASKAATSTPTSTPTSTSTSTPLSRVMLLDDVAAATSARAGRAHLPDAPALMLYTSGTTSKPKGAVLTRANILVQARLLRDAWGVTPEDTLLHALPLHHMHGLAIALVNALLAGASVHLMKFATHDVWRGMKDATMFMAVPTMYAKLLAAFDEAPPDIRAEYTLFARGLRLATSGSAALPVTLGERFRAISGQFPLERFGMTEIGVGLTNPLAGERRPGHVGFPLPSVETRIVGDDGQDALWGELWIRGPSVFPRYHERPEATAAAFADDAQGRRWFRTGDTVTRESESGPFKILGRTSQDILKSGGYKLSALEIEEALREHPGIKEVAVVGLADETWGDLVVACVVRDEGDAGRTLTADGLRAFAKEKLAFYKVPKEVVFRDELPKNALGKVQKPALRATLR